MRTTFLAWNRINCPYFVLLYAILWAAARWSGLSIVDSVPLTFVGIGVGLSVIFRLFVDEKHFAQVLQWLYVLLFAALYASVLGLPYATQWWWAPLVSPGAWFSWLMIVGVAVFLLRSGKEQHEKKIRASWRQSKEVQIISSQIVGLVIGLFIFGHSKEYGISAVIISIAIGVGVFAYTLIQMKKD